MSAKKPDPDRFLNIFHGSNDRCIGIKRKLTDIIMDEIDAENFVPNRKSSKPVRYPVEALFDTQSQQNSFKEQNYKVDSRKNQTRFSIEKRNKISIDMIFEDEDNQSQFKKILTASREKKQFQPEYEIEESDDIFKKGFVKPKNIKYDIDDILAEENLNENDSKSFLEEKISFEKSQNEFQIQSFEFSRILNRKKFNNTEKLDELIGDSSPLAKKRFFSTVSNKYVEEIEDDYLDSFKLNHLKTKSKNTADIDELLKDEEEFQLPAKDKKAEDYFSLACLVALDETETHLSKKASINDPNFDSQEKYTQNQIEIKDDLNFDSQGLQRLQVFKKTNWLEEINLKLDETSIFNNVNESNILANSSNFLSQIENKKKKIKFIKNGYAEKLQKLLMRQKSSINIIKHHLNKKSASERTQKSKNLTNVVKLIPFFRQNFLATKFTLIHAFNLNNLDNDNFKLSSKNICYILLSNDVVDYSSYFDTDVIQSKYLINIYPPWRKFVMKDTKKTIYFSTNLIEIFPARDNELYFEAFDIPKKEFKSIILNALQCPSCLDMPDSDQCSVNLFDNKIYQNALKNQFKSKENPNQNQKNNIFYTQTVSEFLTQASSINTQYLKTNSILDALENIGYYGFANFKATVQRIGLVKNKSMLLYHSQRTQTQHDENQFKRQIIISDKIGLFALIVFPLNLDSYFINESNEYEFNSIKFVEKRTLCNRENFDLNEQITFLCKKLNLKRENNSKKSPKSIQRFIYIFEFISANQSYLTELGNSKEFIPADKFFSLKELKKANSESFWFNLYDIILFKIQFDSLSNEYCIFFVEKSDFLSDVDFKIKKLRIKCIFQIKEKKILSKLDENYIIFESFFEDQKSIIYLKNVGFDNSENENAILFGSFSTVEVADPSKLSVLAKTYDLQHKSLKKSHFENKLPLWRTDLNLKVFDFGLIQGSVINICEDNCCFDFYCQICQNNQMNSENTHQSELNFDKNIESWICNICRNVSEKPLLKIQIQVILNCVGISRKIHLKLHTLTIKKFIRTDCLLEKFVQDEPIDFNVSTLIDKQIGPTICFINKINETQIYAEEIFLDK